MGNTIPLTLYDVIRAVNPFIASIACKVYTWNLAVQKRIAAQNQLYWSATLQITTTYLTKTAVFFQPLIQSYSSIDPFKDNRMEYKMGGFILRLKLILVS